MTLTSRFFPLVVSLTLAAGAAVVPFQAHASDGKPTSKTPPGTCPPAYTKKETGTPGVGGYSYTCTSERIRCDKGYTVSGWQVPGTPVSLSGNEAFAEEHPYPSKEYTEISYTCSYYPPAQ